MILFSLSCQSGLSSLYVISVSLSFLSVWSVWFGLCGLRRPHQRAGPQRAGPQRAGSLTFMVSVCVHVFVECSSASVCMCSWEAPMRSKEANGAQGEHAGREDQCEGEHRSQFGSRFKHFPSPHTPHADPRCLLFSPPLKKNYGLVHRERDARRKLATCRRGFSSRGLGVVPRTTG